MFSFQGASQSYVHAPLCFRFVFRFLFDYWVLYSRDSMKPQTVFQPFAVSVNLLILHSAFSILMVESTGIEPVTSCLQGRRSPSWANPPSGIHFKRIVVGQNGLEPSTSRLSVVCSSQLSYWPILGSTILFSTVPSKLNNVKTLNILYWP